MSAKAKRFYKTVDTAPHEGGYVVRLDGRVLKTPGKVRLVLPSSQMAELVAEEWDSQTEFIVPETMPRTRLMNVAIERVPENREALVAEVEKFAQTDVLSYRESDLAALGRKQAECWDPILAWAAEQGVALSSTQTLIAIDQDDTALALIAEYASDLDNVHLTLFAHFTNVFGSAVLGMAVMKKHLSPEQAFAISRVSEDWQIQQWGEDEDAKNITDALRNEVIKLGDLLS